MLIRARRHAQRGSVLVLVPAGFLVLIILAALAVDTGVYYLGQQQLRDALAAAVNDSVSAGLNNDNFYGNGRISLDPTLVDAIACRSIASQNVSGLHHLRVSAATVGNSVQLVGVADVDAVFGKSIPGYGHHTVRATATAVLTNGPNLAGPAASGPLSSVSCT
jgi:Flp pilus assembly protein TadG